MKICPICGVQVEDSDTFCSACGGRFEAAEVNVAANAVPDATAQNNAVEAVDADEKAVSDAAKLEMPEAPHTLYTPPVRKHAQTAPQQTSAQSGNGFANPAYGAWQNCDPVGMGEWMVDLIVLNIPIVGFVMTFVWGFGTSAKPSLRNFARAMLIFKVILFVLVILLIVLFSVAMFAQPSIYYQYGY
ncbi:MAG: zinc ribbon domain-containing protein [Christensenella sp.]